jgi:hypothetical protein
LVLGDFELEEAIVKKYIVRVRTPLSKHFFSNSFNFFLKFLSADKIIFHGLPLILYAILFPFTLKKTAWIIYGGVDLYFHPEGKSQLKKKLEITLPVVIKMAPRKPKNRPNIPEKKLPKRGKRIRSKYIIKSFFYG